MIVTCPYCQEPAEWVESEVVYGQRFRHAGMIYLCVPCDAWVGTHRDHPETPLGTLAKKDLRDLRRAAHDHLDPLWRSGRYRRKTVYQALNYVFGREIHIGASDIETCRKILALKI